jgi:hypothetical protein
VKKYNVEYVPGLDDPVSISLDARVARYAMYLYDHFSPEEILDLAAKSVISINAFVSIFEQMQTNQEVAMKASEDLRRSYHTISKNRRLTGQIAVVATEELMEIRKSVAEQRNKLVTAGKKGGATRKKKSDPLLKWALPRAAKMRGTATAKARKLANELPDALRLVFEDPERVIREAIRKAEKKT